jgi:hypothetical protein
MEIPTKELIETNGGGFKKVGDTKGMSQHLTNITIIITLS